MADARLLGKRVLRRVLPAPVAEGLLRLRAQAYWWNRRRLKPRNDARVVRALLASGKPIWLELASWTRPEQVGWTFSDLGGGGDLQLDLTRPLPFPDNSVARIYSSHVLEHFSYPSPMLDLLRECHRILRPGGEFSIAVPDARLFLDGYHDPAAFRASALCTEDVGLNFKSPIDFVNFIAYLGGEHKHLFDSDNLPLILQEAGFSQARVRGFDPSVDLAQRRHESVYAIASK
jgi:predicted SAM-dependent methyltransferase